MKSLSRIVRWLLSTIFFFLLLMTLCRLAIYFTFKLHTSNFNNTAKSFWYGFRYDARMVGITALLLLLLSAIPALNPFKTLVGKRIALTVLFMFTLMLVLFNIFDFLHYKYLQQRLNASALSFLEDAKISAGMVWQSYPVIKIVLAIIVLVAIIWGLVKFIFKHYASQPAAQNKAVKLISGLGLFLLLALGIFGRAGQYPLRWSDAFKLGSDFNANLALNPLQSFFSSLNFRHSTYDVKKVKTYYPLMAGYLGVTNADAEKLNFVREVKANDTIKRRPNIVLVICESFSGYKSSMWGNPLNATPYFNSLCKQGVFFDNCFTPSFGTARGVWATITGLPDVELNKTASRNPGMVDQHTIMNDFEGYEKYYFLGGSTSWANIRGLLTNNIQNLHLYEEGSYDVPKIDVWGISDKNLFLEANKVLAKETKPFIAIIQTADNHRPYTIPDEDLNVFEKKKTSEDSLQMFGFENNDEYNAFRYTDFSYQQFMQHVMKEKYYQNTVFAFVGDHGITGNAGDMFPKSWTDNSLTNYHVPLLFYSPTLLLQQRLHCVASQVDVLPTLAGIANINYRNTGLGRDLLQQMKIDSCKSNKAFIMDHNNNDIGMLITPWYYSQNQHGKNEKMVWCDFMAKQNAATSKDEVETYKTITNAFYETTRYLLLNNRKHK